MTNGKTKAVIISAACTLIVAGIAAGGWYLGWQGRIGGEAIKNYQFSELLEKSKQKFEMLEEIDRGGVVRDHKLNGLNLRVDNLDENVRTLIESQERTNEKMDKLSDALMKYLGTRAVKP